MTDEEVQRSNQKIKESIKNIQNYIKESRRTNKKAFEASLKYLNWASSYPIISINNLIDPWNLFSMNLNSNRSEQFLPKLK